MAEDLWAVSTISPGDVFVIASNSGVNGSIVGIALLAKQHGHPVIAVTSLQHTMAVEPKHPSGQRLCDVADVVIDNLAPYGDATLALETGGVPVGSVSSITSAFIAQLLTIGVAERIAATGSGSAALPVRQHPRRRRTQLRARSRSTRAGSAAAPSAGPPAPPTAPHQSPRHPGTWEA